MELRYYGDPILREKAKPVGEITPEIRELVAGMLEMMDRYPSYGIAAPQVGVSLRIFLCNIDHEDAHGEVHVGETLVYINPILSQPSDTLVERTEGCLSIPDLHAPVVRPLSVNVEATDLNGTLFTKECHGYLARCIMHENDHLNGVLYIDRIKGKQREAIEKHLRKIKMKYQK